MIRQSRGTGQVERGLGHPTGFVGPSFSDHIGTLWSRISEAFK